MMMRITAAGLAALTLAACEPTDLAGGGGGTSAFDGSYDQNAANCTVPASETRMTIAADRVTFYEAACDVAARQSGANGTAMTLQCQAEGQQYTRQVTLARMSDGGLTLVDGDLALRYARCAGG